MTLNDPPKEGEKQFLYVIRHGDRWDYAHPEWLETTTRRGDPPLSKLGHQQARETGVFLDNLLAKEAIRAENIICLSSPFVRCLQTSDDILNAFQKIDSEQVQINPEYSVFEMDGHDGRMHASLPPIEERVHYFPRLNIKHESLFVPPLPEARDALLGRCEKAMKLFHWRYPYSPRTAFVIVTHAAACIGIAKAAAGLTVQDITPAAPCGIYQLTRRSQTEVWHLDPHDAEGTRNGFIDHLSDLGTSTKIWNHFGDKRINFGYTGPINSRFAPEPTIETNEEL